VKGGGRVRDAFFFVEEGPRFYSQKKTSDAPQIKQEMFPPPTTRNPTAPFPSGTMASLFTGNPSAF
jgi:hypothetical protein